MKFNYLAIFVFQYAIAQNNVQWGPLIGENKNIRIDFIGYEKKTENTFWLVNKTGGDFIYVFSRSNEKRFEIKLEPTFPITGYKSFVDKILFFNGRFYAVVIHENKQDRLTLLRISEFSVKGVEVNKSTTLDIKNRNQLFLYKIQPSTDSTKLLVAVNLPQQKGVDLDKVLISEFDLSLKRLNTKEVILKDFRNPETHHVEIGNVIFNKNKIVITGDEYSDQWNRDNSAFWIVSPDSNSVTKIRFNKDTLSNKIKAKKDSVQIKLGNTATTLTNKGEIAFVGFFEMVSLKNQEQTSSGVFYSKLDTQSKQFTNFNYTIVDSVYKKFYQDVSFSTRNILNVTSAKDGALILMMEEFRSVRKGYEFNSINIARFDQNGHFRFFSGIFKRQLYYRSIYHQSKIEKYSYLPFYNDKSGYLSIIFNGKEQKKLGDSSSYFSIGKEPLTQMMSFDSTGNILTRIFEKERDDAFISPLNSVVVNANRIYLIGLNKEGFKIGKLIDTNPLEGSTTTKSRRLTLKPAKIAGFTSLFIASGLSVASTTGSITNWLHNHGCEVHKSILYFDFQFPLFPILFTVKKPIIGLDLGGSLSISKSDIAFGRVGISVNSFRSKNKLNSPLVGLGLGYSFTSFANIKIESQNALLTTTSLTNSIDLSTQGFYLNPTCKLFKKFGSPSGRLKDSQWAGALDIGFRLFINPFAWTVIEYNSDGKRINEYRNNKIPKASFVTFYINFPFGRVYLLKR